VGCWLTGQSGTRARAGQQLGYAAVVELGSGPNWSVQISKEKGRKEKKKTVFF
jgi:hypothetical protein